MGEFEVLRFNNDDELAQTAASQWLAKLPGQSSFSVALSGGRIARKFFSVVAAVPGAAKKLQNVHFFWGDERCVPPFDRESNFGMAQELLLGPLAIPADHVHRIKGEIDPTAAAREATEELLRQVLANSERQPVIDLIFLGMGEDGHTASLFPTEPQEMRNDPAIYRAVIGPKPPPRRITLGYLTIASAREVWVLASGSGKEEAFQRSLSTDGRTPLAHVIQSRQSTRVLTDIPI